MMTLIHNLVLTTAITTSGIASAASDGVQQPNIVVILADELGYAELGCFGQEKIMRCNGFLDQ